MKYYLIVLFFSNLHFMSTTGKTCRPTSPATEGPFYIRGAPSINGTLCAGTSMSHQRLIISGKVLDATDCRTPLPSTLDIWHANMDGHYSHFEYSTSYDCRGTIETDARGHFVFQTKFPGRYLTNKAITDSYRPSHIHLKITPKNRSYGGSLTTQLYFENDEYLGSRDHCSSNTCKSDEPSLVTSVNNLRDLKTFEGRWNVYIKPGGNGVI